ncbi:hypothetical protein LNP00_00445 [Fructobacillus sp. M158]|uniref:hypothetical protein n=1 Tax=Fructobacillus parabroussonetiae TaxID=2713174 RepID=UPI00200AF1EB|nr:hypothetical protein [Fructobacillus parabroussonetiae]MCK8616840.1 hypothetical protein [Fructobacillus parabroussonetiae]
MYQLFKRQNFFYILILVLSVILSAALLFSPLDGFSPYLGPLYRIGGALTVFLVIFWLLKRKFNTKSLYVYLAVVGVVQIIFLLTFNWPMYVDTGYVMTMAGRIIEGHHEWYRYFYYYPNNVNITIFWSVFLKPLHMLGVTNYLHIIPFFQMAFMDFSILVLFTKLKQYNQKFATMFLVFTTIYLPWYMYTLMAYSDILTVSLLMLMTASYISLNQTSDKKIKVFYTILTFGLILLAFYLRQNAVIILIGLLLTGIFNINWTNRFKFFFVITGLIFTLGSLTISNKIQKHEGYVPNKEIANPTISWVTMSWNPTSSGEVIPGESFPYKELNSKDRSNQLKSDLISRLKTLGPFGIVKHAYKKVVYMFSVADVNQDFHGFQISTSLIGSQYKSSVFLNWIGNLFQPIYIIILSFALYGVFALLKNFTRAHSIEKNVLLLSCFSILGIFAFHILFWEVRDRYSLPLTPFLLMMSAYGVSCLANIPQEERLSKKKGLVASFIAALFLIAGLLLPFNTTHREFPQFAGNSYQSGFGMYTEFGKELYSVKGNSVYRSTVFQTKGAANKLTLNLGSSLTYEQAQNLEINLYKSDGHKIWSSHAYEGSWQPFDVQLPEGKYSIEIRNMSGEAITIPCMQGLQTSNIQGPDISENGKRVNGLNMIFNLYDLHDTNAFYRQMTKWAFVLYLVLSVLVLCIFLYVYFRT